MEPQRRVIAQLRTGATREASERIRLDFLQQSQALSVPSRLLFQGADEMPLATSCLLTFVVLETPNDAVSRAIVADVSSTRFAEYVLNAYVEPAPMPPPVIVDDERYKFQNYLNPKPVGIDANSAWLKTGGDGTGVRLVVVEQGWILDHEDLVDAHIRLLFGVNHSYQAHGAGVLGIVAAVDNAIGCLGVAPEVSANVASEHFVDQWGVARYNTAEAIWETLKTGWLRAGDVLLIEAQTTDTTGKLVPAEYDPATRCVIDYATDQLEIVVIEPAANGGLDLGGVLSSPQSKAILVGAAYADAPHRRHVDSNYGNYVDCFGWGDSIYTCGNSKKAYTPDFGGTSGAAAMVAGAAVLIQSLSRARTTGAPLPIGDVRRLLRDTTNGTPSENGGNDKIGYMPNLKWIETQIP
jgi:subtilisin family serine protease